MSLQKPLTSLALYHYQACPFCAITRQAIDATSLDIEQRDTLIEPEHRSTLIKEGGKSQVPCLRIEREDGTVEWLYESADIIRFIAKTAQQNAA